MEVSRPGRSSPCSKPDVPCFQEREPWKYLRACVNRPIE
jgi:hypothetical protein